MGKNLVIVESPAKAKKINQFLGPDYVVKASLGHVRDLPPRKLGVDIENNFKPEYVDTTTGKKVISELKKEAAKADKVFLAPDPDREGEAIAWHLFEALKDTVPEENFYRVTYNEITKPAILEAFQHPEKINMNRVDAQQARRVLDRLVGYVGSPVVRRQIRGANSVGRVQTVALRLVCEREKKIASFKPETYFVLGAKVRKQTEPLDPFTVKLVRINNEPVGVKDRKLLPGAIKTQEQLDAIRNELIRCELNVSRIIEKTVQRKPRPPFITSSLQQAASSVLGYVPARTMNIAQKLYENGLITYMRTDSFNIAKSAQDECRAFVKGEYGSEYLPDKPNVYKSKGSAQEAHEAIRPTDVNLVPGDSRLELSAQEKKLYKLIWERFVASQMVPARIARRIVEINACAENTYLFRATTSGITFPGYMKVSGIESAADNKKNGDDDNEETEKLPPLVEGENLDCLDWLTEKKETKPPSRYTEASLIRMLEENGVGRPSTYAAILSKLDERKYVTKQKRSLIPTKLGMDLIDLVLKTEEKLKSEDKVDLFEVNFTADMETRLDQVEEGRIEWTRMMKEFYPSLLEWINNARETASAEEVNKYFHALESVTEWNPPVKRNNRVYDDAKTVKELREDVANGKKLSKRQAKMLHSICCRYIDQIPPELVRELKLTPEEKPREDTHEKIALLAGVQFEKPRTVGKRVYDDAKFFASLKEQVEYGKKLSSRQLAALDSLLVKYADQIDNFEELKAKFGLEEKKKTESADSAVAPLLELLKNVKEWVPPTKRGKREFNDLTFYESLTSQFKTKGTLSVKQVAALKKLIARYADQIPNYEQLQKLYKLPAAGKTWAKQEKTEAIEMPDA